MIARSFLIAGLAAAAGWAGHALVQGNGKAGLEGAEEGLGEIGRGGQVDGAGHAGVTPMMELIRAKQDLDLDLAHGDRITVMLLSGPPGEVILLFERVHILDGLPAWRRKVSNLALDSEEAVELELDDGRPVVISPQGKWGEITRASGRRFEIQVVE